LTKIGIGFALWIVTFKDEHFHGARAWNWIMFEFEGIFRHLDNETRDVGGQFHVNGKFPAPSCEKEPIDLSSGILGTPNAPDSRSLSLR